MLFRSKLEPTYNDVSIDLTQWYDAETDTGQLVRNADGSVVARVVQSVDPTGVGGAGDPPTLIVTYKTGAQFQDGDVIYDVDSSAAVQAISSASTGLSSLASISHGVFYVLGNFVQIQPQTIVVDKYNNSPSKRIGLQITESWRDYIDDASLLDPALGASNYQAPGADRLKLVPYLSVVNTSSISNNSGFYSLVDFKNGTPVTIRQVTALSNTINSQLAERTFETNGNFIVNPFLLSTAPIANTANTLYANNVNLVTSSGIGYVREIGRAHV